MVRGHKPTSLISSSFSSKLPMKYAYRGSKLIMRMDLRSGIKKYSPVALKPEARWSAWFMPRTALVIPTDFRVGELMNERNCFKGKTRKRVWLIWSGETYYDIDVIDPINAHKVDVPRL